MHASIAEREQFRSLLAAKIRFSEQKTKIFLSFFEREYLRAVFTAQSYDKFPNPPRLGGEISVCLGMLDIKEPHRPFQGSEADRLFCCLAVRGTGTRPCGSTSLIMLH